MHEMQRHPVGASGVEISRIGLGGYELGPEPDEEPDAQRAAGVIGAALEGGVNWLDTSENYLATHNEEVIGEALQLVGGDFLVASKVAPEPAITGGGSGFRREEVLQACRDSLTRLRRDHLDVYFLHWPDERGVLLDETWGAMGELVDAGLVRAIGLSNYRLEDVERCHAERPVDVVQVGLSLVDYLEDRQYIASCGELGIAVTIYEPLASGILSGKTREQILALWGGGVWEEASFFKRLLGPGNAEKSFAVADGLRPIAEELNATVAQVAIAWVLHQPGVTAAIAGSRSETHTRDNAGAARVALSPAILDRIEQLIPLGPAAPTLA